MKSKKKLWIRFVIIMAFAVLFLLFALFAGKFAPYDPLETHYTDLLKAPCKQYLMGTDQMGRDIFSRILYGGKTSLLIAFVVTAIISVVGILIGTIAGFWGGAFDAVLMRLSDMLMAFPGSIFTIALVSFLGTGLPNLILAMTITGWTYYARISRSLVLDGVVFGDDLAYLVIGIAGVGDDHLEILSNIAISLEDETLVDKLKNTSDKFEILKTFNK